MKLTARYFSEADVEARVQWINDPRINVSMFFDLPASVEKTLNWAKSIKDNNSRVDFTIVDEENNIVAMGGFTGIDRVHKHAEHYMMVNPEMHGKGYGKKASLWICNYVFLKFDLHKIFLYTDNHNIASYKIYENSGFQLEGILRDHKWKNGSFQNRRFYGLLESEWQQASWKNNEINYIF